jgi:hypothetical protein
MRLSDSETQRCEFVDETITVHAMDRLTVVVAISDQHHGASSSAGGLGVVL